MPNHLITYGKDRETGQLRSVKDVESGLACNCNCPNCGCALEACKGKIRQHHFRHYSVAECKGAFESQLHILSKAFIAQNKAVMLPDYRGEFCEYKSKKQCFDEVVQEAYVDGKRPDCLCKYIDEQGTMHEIWVEICYKHPVDSEKTKFIKDNAITCLEIDVRSLFKDSMIVDEAALTNFLLNSTENRAWVNYPDGDELYLKAADEVRHKNIIDFLSENSDDASAVDFFCMMIYVLYKTGYQLPPNDYNKLYEYVKKQRGNYQSLNSIDRRCYIGAIQLLLCDLTQLGYIFSRKNSKEQVLWYYSFQRKEIESELSHYIEKVINKGNKHLPLYTQRPIYNNLNSNYVFVPGKGFVRKRRF